MNFLQRFIVGGILIGVIAVCAPTSTDSNLNGSLSILSMVSSQENVVAGDSALISCKVRRPEGARLTYAWEASGSYGVIVPKDSICQFFSPTCHQGYATVSVIVTDSMGVVATASVELNKSFK